MVDRLRLAYYRRCLPCSSIKKLWITIWGLIGVEAGGQGQGQRAEAAASELYSSAIVMDELRRIRTVCPWPFVIFLATNIFPGAFQLVLCRRNVEQAYLFLLWTAGPHGALPLAACLHQSEPPKSAPYHLHHNIQHHHEWWWP